MSNIESFRHPPPGTLKSLIVTKSLISKKTYFYTLKAGVLTQHTSTDSSAKNWAIYITDSQIEGNNKRRAISITLNIQKKKKVIKLSFDDERTYTSWLTSLTETSAWKLQNFYEIGDDIGEGQFAKVKKGYGKTDKTIVAIKSIMKAHPNPKISEFVEREYEIMKVVDHPDVIKTYDVFDTVDRLYIVLEYCPGGMLFDIISAERSLSEQKASSIMKQIFSGLEYLHKLNIVHRDIKPDNILCMNKNWPIEIKIADFGLATFLSEEDDYTMTSQLGTPYYVAPEIASRRPYGPPVDLWACGVLLYIMLSGRFPFIGNHPDEVVEKIINGKFTFPEHDWKDISPEAKKLIRDLLTLEPTVRMTASQALQSPWICDESIQKDQDLHHIKRVDSLIHLKTNKERAEASGLKNTTTTDMKHSTSFIKIENLDRLPLPVFDDELNNIL